MKIIIKRFRKYEEKVVYEFSDGQINLLCGNSGSGKTTIFEAIAWCLYGKEQQIYPKNTKPSNSQKTSVKLILNGFFVERQKPPDSLKIKFDNGNEIIDKDADNYIYNYFGSKGLWYSSSYSSQGSKNPLIVFSNSQKFELLKELTFGTMSNEEPSFYEENVNFELSKIKKKIGDNTQKFNGYKESYNHQIELNNEIINQWKDLLEVEFNNEKFYELLTEKIKTIKKKYKKSSENLINLKKNYDEKNLLYNNNLLIFENIKNLKNQESQISFSKVLNKKELTSELELMKLSLEFKELFYLEEHDEINENKEINELNNIKSIYENSKLRKIYEIKNQMNLIENYEKYKILYEKYKNDKRVQLEEKKKEILNINIKNTYEILLKNHENYLKMVEELNSLKYLKIHDNLNTYEKEKEMEKLLNMKRFYNIFPNDNYYDLKTKFLEISENIKNQNTEIEKKLREYEIYKKNKTEYLSNCEKLKNLYYLEEHDCLDNQNLLQSEILKLMNMKNIYIELKLKKKDDLINFYKNNKNKYEKYEEYLKLCKETEEFNNNLINAYSEEYEKQVINLKNKQNEIIMIKKENQNAKTIYDLEIKNYNKYLSQLEENSKKDDFKNEIQNSSNLISDENLKFMIKNNINEKSHEIIESLKLSLKEYNCPHCKKGFVFTGGVVYPGKSNLEEKEKYLEILSKLEIFVDMKYHENILPLEIPKEFLCKEIDESILNEKIIYKIPEKKPLPEKITKICLLNVPENIENFMDLEKIENKLISINNRNFYYDLKEKTKTEPVFSDNLENLQKKELPEDVKKFFKNNFLDVILPLEEINELLESLNNKDKYLSLKKNTLKIVEMPIEPLYENVDKELLNLEIIEPKEVIFNGIIFEKKDIEKILDKNLEYNEIEKKLLSLKNKKRFYELKELDLIKNISKFDIEKKINEINENDKNIQNNFNLQNKKDHIKNEIERLSGNLKNFDENSKIKLEEIKTEIDEVNEKIENYKKLIDSSKILISLSEQNDVLEEKRKKILSFLNYEKNLNEIKNVISEVSTSSMEEIIDSINTISNNIISLLFEDPISIKLSTHKTLKTGDEKLQVNLKITYNGHVYDNSSYLSGGENDRISFCITLALAKITGVKFLLLDECMSSLDGELREKSIKVLKNMFQNLTIIHICHETIKGIHDNVVNVN